MIEVEKEQLKTIINEVLIDVLNTNKDVIYDIFMEAMEDFYLLKAIKEGESSGLSTREEVFAILEAED